MSDRVKILIGADVDPRLPEPLRSRPDDDVWEPLARIPELERALGSALPPITWLIRSDQSIQFATGDYASGYTRHRTMWTGLVRRGHELGWHVHAMSFNEARGSFVFDPAPSWLDEAHAALAAHVPVRASRLGWTFANDFLFRELDRLGVELDFSALPGSVAWYRADDSVVFVDWRRCPLEPYRPDRDDYQRSGPNPLRLVELPIAQFSNSVSGMLKRFAWRIAHGCFSTAGSWNRTLQMTEAWSELPRPSSGVWAFYFHPEELTADGIRHFAANVERLRRLPQVEFITASAARDQCATRLARGSAA